MKCLVRTIRVTYHKTLKRPKELRKRRKGSSLSKSFSCWETRLLVINLASIHLYRANLQWEFNLSVGGQLSLLKMFKWNSSNLRNRWNPLLKTLSFKIQRWRRTGLILITSKMMNLTSTTRVLFLAWQSRKLLSLIIPKAQWCQFTAGFEVKTATAAAGLTRVRAASSPANKIRAKESRPSK